MTEQSEKIRDDEYLQGRQNYYSWLKNFNDYCYLESYYVPSTNAYSETSAAVKAMKKWIHKRVGNGPARDIFKVDNTILEILGAFNTEFGSGHADPDTLIEAIKSQIYFDSRKNPEIMLNWLGENIRTVNSAFSSAASPNQEISDDDYRLIILKGLENVSSKTEFWKLVYGNIKQKKREGISLTQIDLKKALINHWYDHSAPEIILQETSGQTVTSLRPRVPYAGNVNARIRNGNGT